MFYSDHVILSLDSPVKDEYESLNWKLLNKRDGSIAGAVSLSKENTLSTFMAEGLSDLESAAVKYAINHIICEAIAEKVLLRIRDEHADCEFDLGNDDALIHIYYLKKYTLIAQNYFNDEYFNMVFDTIDPINGKSQHEICQWCARRINAIQKIVPERVIDDCYDADYEMYTDRFYHRKFWNEIPNDRATEIAFNAFRDYIEDAYKTGDSTEFELSLYDYNDEAIFFSSLKAASDFIQHYDCCPYTLFQNSNGVSTELFSA